ncbi:MAG: NADPH:quinone reductase [Bosea sp.]|jgi:NADPH2:quinone reductase|nr:NADPH:quinone reductase [Bosea sp. (in: a-proteobacteria)]
MRAVWYEKCGVAADVLRLGDLACPQPGPDQVLVRVLVSGVNPHDVKKRSGWTGGSLPAERVIPHSDGAGVVAAVGSGVSGARIGERVWVMHASDAYAGAGAAAEYAIVHEDHAVPLPHGVGFDVGACLGVPFMTAHDAVLRDGPVAGQTVLVQGGAGAVAAYAIQIAVLGGADVIASASSPEKAGIAMRLGARATVDYRAADASAHIMQLTSGRGVNRIIEVDFGANLALDQAVIQPHGIIASYSSSRVREPLFPYYAFASRAVTIHIVQGMLLTHGRARAGIRHVTELLSGGLLTHMIARIFPMEHTADAHALQESGTAIGKVLVASAD